MVTGELIEYLPTPARFQPAHNDVRLIEQLPFPAQRYQG
jgi:hypothetical protein